MLYSYERMQRFVLGGYSWETDPQPPASAAIAKPKEIIDLAAKIMRAYPKAGQRIA